MHAATPAPSLPEDSAAVRALLLAVLAQRDTLAAERDAAVAQNERLPEDQLLFAFEEIEATLAGRTSWPGLLMRRGLAPLIVEAGTGGTLSTAGGSVAVLSP